MWATFTWRAALSPGRRTHSALAQLRCILDGELEGIRGAGTWKNERVITSRQGPCIRVDGMSGGNFPFWESSYLVRRPRARPRLACEWRPLGGCGREARALRAAGLSGEILWPPSVNSTCLNLFGRREVICPSAPFGCRGLGCTETQPCEKKRAISSCISSQHPVSRRIDQNKTFLKRRV